MKHLKKYGHIIAISTLTLCAFFILANLTHGEDNNLQALNDHRATIARAQKSAADAHESLAKAKEATAAAVAAEQKAQSIVDGYSKAAAEARTAICNLGKEFCTRENLDPLSTQTNVDEYLQ